MEILPGLFPNTSIGISMIFSIILFIKFLFNPDISNSFELYTWMHSDKFIFSLGILVDSLSVFMAFVVTSVSFLVHVYSVGYMDKDEGYNRFFIYTNFFTFSMLLIVFSNNFLQLFIGWELVGLSSYLLIGFWVHKETAIAAVAFLILCNPISGIFIFLIKLFFLPCNRIFKSNLE